ncbi:MAG TPA: replication-relaxation family protein [Candidatus Angelobacter sp.]|jgi:hypothetical protein|nr:replication-relaxation family protein [Candidatus Angelobacter sp.]
MTARNTSGRLSGRVDPPRRQDGGFANDSSVESRSESLQTARGSYVTARRLPDLAAALDDRDWQIIRTLQRVRVATGDQLARLHCADFAAAAGDRQCRRVLASLAERGIVARLGRSIGGVRAGSRGWVYALDRAGQRLVTGAARLRRPWTPGVPFLAHSLAVTELYVRLVEAHRVGAVELVSFVTEPGCWRTFTAAHGRAVLKPDAFVVTAHDEFEDRWFVEVDQGTEAASTLDRKLDVYTAYWRSGSEQQATGTFPRVLWLAPTPVRHGAIVDACGRQPVDAWPLFTVALLSEAVERIAQGAAT